MDRQDAAFWHHRFRQQAYWTLDLRRFLYEQVSLRKANRVLEVGSGTGAVTAELSHIINGCVLGLDIDLNRLTYAHELDPRPLLTAGNALALPYASQVVDFSVCHFLLLWLNNPLQALIEMRRVTRSGGAVLALAEPDYGGRIDHPAALVELGRLQAQALARQGADPSSGRRLSGLFHQAGLTRIQTGVLGGQWSVPPTVDAWESEWEALESDLAGVLTPQKLADLRRTDQAAWQHGERVLFVPTFYAIGYVE
jgi:ubiquinone/menaquinone biosynthesis C-methylase UbiE